MRQAVPLSEIEQRLHVDRVAVDVDGHDRAVRAVMRAATCSTFIVHVRGSLSTSTARARQDHRQSRTR